MRGRHVVGRVVIGVLVLVSVLTPPLVGAVAATETPATVTLAPGLSIDAAVQHTGTSVVDFGAIGAVALPRVHAHVPVVGSVSADLRVSPVTLNASDQDTLSLYAALLRDPQTALARPVERSFARRAEVGATLGALLDAVAGLALLGLRTALHRWRRQNAEVRAALDELEPPDVPGDDATTGLAHVRALAADDAVGGLTRRALIAGLAIAVLVVAGGGAFVAHEWHHSRHAATPAGQPLDDALVSLSPYLRDATVTGSGAQLLVNKALSQVLADKDHIDEAYDRIDADLAAAFSRRDAAGSLSPLHDPRYIPMLDISDGHCALPYYEKVLPELIHLTGVHLVLNTGDTDISTGRLPFEGECTDTIGAALQPTPEHPDRVDMVVVDGNHDGSVTADRLRRFTARTLDGDRYHPIVVLDAKDDDTATVDGIPFVGSPDPRQSIFGTDIQPFAADEQHRVVAEQGRRLADVACAAKDVAGFAPILLTHDPGAAYATLARGCTAFATSGHTHHQAGPVTYATPGGKHALVFTQGTSAGVGQEAFTVYATPKGPAPQTVFLYDPATHAIAGWYDIEIAPDLTVSVSPFIPVPAAQPVPDSLYDELALYTPDVLTQPSASPLAVPPSAP